MIPNTNEPAGDSQWSPADLYPADPFHQGIRGHSRDSLFSLPNGSIDVGIIVDTIPHTRCYSVMTAGQPFVTAMPMGSTGLNVITGPNEFDTLPPGSMVLLWQPADALEAVILGSLPPQMSEGGLVVPPTLAPGSDVGVTNELLAQAIRSEEFGDAGWGVFNRSAGTPADSLVGDHGVMNEYDGGYLISKMVSFIRAAENCGVYMFNRDMLMRLHAYNLETFTHGLEHRHFNDEGEIHDVMYRAKFPWEALGFTKHGVDAFEEADGAWDASDDSSSDARLKALYEPHDPKQTGAWRELELRGYLGDGRRKTILLPKDYSETPAKYGDEDAYAGLSEITEGFDGRIGIRSAKEIILSKYMLIPVPHQLTLPDDHVDGDWHTDYKASGELGDGEGPEDQEDFDWGDSNADMKAGLLTDYMAFVFNFFKFENMLGHKKDWKIPEESAKHEKLNSENALIGSEKLSKLETNFWADLPEAKDVEIDGRMTKAKFYESMSAIAMLDDGSVVLEDGWGSQIVMTRGNIKITAPGDIMMLAGRSVQAWGPKDVIVRAGRSIDLTATEKDIRLKAERNLHMLGGNDGQGTGEGGVLIESRSEGMTFDFEEGGEKSQSGGIIFRAPNSDVVTWGKNVYISSQEFEDGSAGDVGISAGRGDGSVFVQGKYIVRDIGEMAVDDFGDQLNVYSESMTVMDTGTLTVRGTIFASGDGAQIASYGNILAGGSLVCEGSGAFGGSLSDGADTPHMLAGNSGAPKGTVKPPVKAQDTAAQIMEQSVDTLSTTQDEKWHEGDTADGNADNVKKSKFSLRTDDDYGADGFELFAARWQVMYSNYTISSHRWEENPVVGNAPTYPYPGRQYHTPGKDSYYEGTGLKMFDMNDGAARAKDRGEDGGPYADRSPEEQTPTSLSNYLCTIDVKG